MQQNFSFQGGRTEDWDWERNKGDARSTTHDPNLHKHSSGRKPMLGVNTKLFMRVQKLQICLFQFGDAAKFQPELNTVAARVQKQEAELSALQVK